MKKILFFFFLNLSYLSFSQMGIGTTTPRGDLDLNNPLTNTFGLVLPTNANVANMQNPQGGSIAFGTMMYDSSAACIKYYQQNIVDGKATASWSNCLLTDRENLPSIDYIIIDNSFTGNYQQNVAMIAANTFKIAITNTSFTSISMNLARTDLILSGIEGIEVSGVSPRSVTLQPGQVQVLTYTLTGSPKDCGSLTGTWRKISLKHTASVDVKPNITYSCNIGTWSNPVVPEHRLNGLINGQSYTGTYTMPYTNTGTCGGASAETITNNGLTLTFAGAPANSTGLATYVLSGTYTGTDSGSASFTTAGGCVIYLGPSASCKEILQLFPGSPSNVYKIDPDKQGTTYNTMNAQCDMTTDGGGWTMVLNYLHLGGTTPAISIRTTLPVIGSSTLGTNEGGNATTWGNGNRSLQAALRPTEYRFFGRTSLHDRVIHFKTSHAGSITYFTTGVGSASGIQNSFTPLVLHTASLPASADSFRENMTSSTELLDFPFYTADVRTWGIDGQRTGRWEMDDFSRGDAYNTLHRVWVR